MWYRTVVKYKVQNARGKWKPRKEEYLINGISYTDVEVQLIGLTEGRITDYTHIIREASFRDVYEPHAAGAFYMVTVEEEVFQKSGEPKKRTYKQLVVAGSVSDAQDRAAAYMKNWISDQKIIGADITAFVGVWHPHASQWQDDFKSRAADGFARGGANADPAQTTMFNPDGTIKDDDLASALAPLPDGADLNQATKDLLAESEQSELSGFRKKKTAKIRFLKKDGEPVDD